jgi:hypothetical protein
VTAFAGAGCARVLLFDLSMEGIDTASPSFTATYVPGAGHCGDPCDNCGTECADLALIGIVNATTCATLDYCTAGTSASGCEATLSATGVASASAATGFVITAATVEGQKDGLFFFGTNGQQANPWGNGTSYQWVVPPVKRCDLLAARGRSAPAMALHHRT